MGAEARKYFAYARECARQAGEATTAERRDKLLELARVWTIAALTEGNIVVPPASTETPQPQWQNGNGRQFARNPATSLSATAIVLCALATSLRPPTTGASTPLWEMNSSAVGRMIWAGSLAVRLVKLAPWSVVPKRLVLSATKYRRCERGSSTMPVGAWPPAVA